MKEDTVLSVQSAGLAASVATSGLATLLLPWTLTIVIAVLCTHRGSLGWTAASSFH